MGTADGEWTGPRSPALAELWELVDEPSAPVPFGALVKARRRARRPNQDARQVEESRCVERALLHRFEQQQGDLVNALHAKRAIAACALTEGHREGQPPRRLHTVLNSTSDRLLSMETRCTVLAEDSVSVLSRHRRLRPELVASTDAAYGAMTLVVRAADLMAGGGGPDQQRAALTAARKQIQLVTVRVGLLIQRQARFTYFLGVLVGALAALLVTALLGIAGTVWWSGTLNPPALTAAGAFGVLGAVVSVFQRISTGKLVLDFTAPDGQKYLLGGLRPFVGLVSGLFVHFALLAGLAQGAGPASTTTVAFSATVGFVAGFSERFFTDMIERAGQLLTGAGSGGPNPAAPATGGSDVNDAITADVRDDELTGSDPDQQTQPAPVPAAPAVSPAGPDGGPPAGTDGASAVAPPHLPAAVDGGASGDGGARVDGPSPSAPAAPAAGTGAGAPGRMDGQPA